MGDDLKSGFNRRDLLKIGGAATAGFVAGKLLSPGAAQSSAEPRELPPLPSNPKSGFAMPTRNLGKTGYRVCLFGLGGQAAIEMEDNEDIAVPIIERALDLGVNYIDTAAFYGGPHRWSQRYVGRVMKRRRAEAFLATKTHDRTRDGSLRLLEESLKLLQTDHLDLWQLHDIRTKHDVDRILGKRGAIEALEQAKQQHLVRFLGVTGHFDPDVLIYAIQQYPFDNLLLSLNAADRHHLSFIDRLLPMAVEKQMGVIGMKIPARGRILSKWTPSLGSEKSWAGGTRPGTLDMKEALYYVLSLPVSAVIIGCDSVQQLEENVQLASEFTPLNDTQMRVLSAKAEPVAPQALFFRRWS
jgi:aryl-alcohol dehydrogenase-like predicted oxidoreductase